jgi:peptide/nickel transport system permease protein
VSAESVSQPSAIGARAVKPLNAGLSQQRTRARRWRVRVGPRLVIAASVLAAVAACALLPERLAPFDPLQPSIGARLAPPFDRGHLLGTDTLGRDLLSRIVFGARISAIVGISAVLLAGSVGVLLGLLSGFYGGAVDAVIARAADIVLTIPYLVLAVAVVAVFGGGLVTLVAVLAISTWVTYTRIVRGEVLVLRQSEFVEAARAIGSSNARLIRKHLLPNVSTSIIVVATQQLAAMILYEAALSFLGLGVRPPTPTWGGMVADGRSYLATAWWVSTLPGIAILLTVVAVNWFGDWLRDALDPRKLSPQE